MLIVPGEKRCSRPGTAQFCVITLDDRHKRGHLEGSESDGYDRCRHQTRGIAADICWPMVQVMLRRAPL